MKILADQNIPHAETFFGQLGDVVRAPGRELSRDQLADVDALIVRSVTQVNAQLLEQTPVQFVGTCTIGTDHLDIGYLNQRNIAWASAQGCNANSVVEYVFAALALCRPDWLHSSIGIIGCGNVGGRLYRRLCQLGVKTRVYDPFLSEAEVADLTSLDQVLAADIVCVHTPLTKAGPHPTQGMLGAAQLSVMQPNALLLNAGRGEVIDGQALLAHLRSQPDFCAVLDVWENEPNIAIDLMQQVAVATPHIAGYSYDGKVKGTEMIYQALCTHLGSEPQISAAQVLPSEAQQILTAAAKGVDDLSLLLAQAYDIAADDKATRQALNQAQQQGLSIGQAFDALRKNYPQRREWHNFNLPKHGLSEPLINVLSSLGFKP